MKRRHLFEFEDQPWLPAVWRDLLTDVLRHHSAEDGMYDAALPRLADLLRRSGARRVIDCCSGAAGPWPGLLDGLGRLGLAPEVLLTDKYPNRRAARRIALAGDRRIAYHPQPVDATGLPPELVGLRTFFSSFHHFRPAAARAILRDAAARRQPIGIFEFTLRHPAALRGMLRSPAAVFAATRAIRPRRRARLLWTYLIPVVPLLYWWDGTVSHLRTYTPAELRELAAAVPADGYRWEAGLIPSPGCPLTYLAGWPTGH